MLFEVRIRDAVALAEAPSNGQDIFPIVSHLPVQKIMHGLQKKLRKGDSYGSRKTEAQVEEK